MDKSLYDNILRYDKFVKMFDKIEECVNKNDMKNAYYKTAAILELVNAIILLRKFKIKIENTNIVTYIKYYSNLDQELYNQMMNINTQYNIVDDDNPELDDIEYLLLKIDYIIKYVTQTYGEIFN